MNLNDAKAAGQLAAYLQPRLDMVQKLDAMIENGWVVCGVQAKDASGGSGLSLLLDDLDPGTSAAVLQYAKQIYQAQIDAAQAQLDAL